MLRAREALTYLEVQTLNLHGVWIKLWGRISLRLASPLFPSLFSFRLCSGRLLLEEGILFRLDLDFLLLQRSEDAGAASGEQRGILLQQRDRGRRSRLHGATPGLLLRCRILGFFPASLLGVFGRIVGFWPLRRP